MHSFDSMLAAIRESLLRPQPQEVYFALGAGIVLGIFAVLLAVRTRRFLVTAVRVDGTVVELIESSSPSKRGSVFTPVMSFVDAAGERHRVTSNVSSSPPAFRVGQGIAVLYPPGQPAKAEYQGWFAQWGAPVIFGVMSLVALLVAKSFYLAA